jgi:alpha-tubulin suppressor-like RCC1 family protein
MINKVKERKMAYKTNWLCGVLAPMLIMGSAHALHTNIAASGAHSVFIDKGTVFAMGSNAYGEIVPGTTGEFRTPLSMSIQNAYSVAASQHRIAVLKMDGTAQINGRDFVTYKNTSVPFPTSGITDIALALIDVYYIKDSQVYKWNGSTGTPEALVGGSNAQSIAAGQFHLVVLFKDGTVGTYGTNSSGQLGTGDNVNATSVVKLTGLPMMGEVAASGNSTFLNTYGSFGVYSFGDNSSGQLGLSDSTNRLVPTLVPATTNVIKMLPGGITSTLIMGDGTLLASGYHDWIGGAFYTSNNKFVTLPVTNVMDGATGSDHTVVKMNGTIGKLSGWGGNVGGKLGDATNTERHTLTEAFWTPIPDPVVVVAPPPVVVVAPTPDPVSLGSAIMNPLTPEPPPVVMPDNKVTVVDAIIATVVDAVVAVVDAVKQVVDAVVAVVTPTPPAPPVVVPPPVVTPPVVVPPPVVVKQHEEEHDKAHSDNRDGDKHDGIVGNEHKEASVAKRDDDHKEVEVKKTASKKEDDKKDSKKKS